MAEVDNRDLWKISHLGIACVNSDAVHIQQIFSRILQFLKESAKNYQLLNEKQTIISGF